MPKQVSKRRTAWRRAEEEEEEWRTIHAHSVVRPLAQYYIATIPIAADRLERCQIATICVSRSGWLLYTIADI